MRDVLSRRIARLEESINGGRQRRARRRYRSALLLRLEQLHERMAAVGTLHEPASLDDIKPALRDRLEAAARSAGQLRGGSDARTG